MRIDGEVSWRFWIAAGIWAFAGLVSYLFISAETAGLFSPVQMFMSGIFVGILLMWGREETKSYLFIRKHKDSLLKKLSKWRGY